MLSTLAIIDELFFGKNILKLWQNISALKLNIEKINNSPETQTIETLPLYPLIQHSVLKSDFQLNWKLDIREGKMKKLTHCRLPKGSESGSLLTVTPPVGTYMECSKFMY